MNTIEDKAERILIFFIVIAIILIGKIVYTNVYGINFPFLLIQLMMIVANIIAILLFCTYKLIAYKTKFKVLVGIIFLI